MKTQLAVAAAALIAAVAAVHADVGRVLSDPPERRVQKDPAYQATPAAKPAQPSTPPGRVDAGGVLYKKVGCYQCHSNEAQGGLSGPRIGPNVVPFARFSQYIRTPTGEMPPYTPKVLSDRDIADLYAWVQARPRPPAVNTIPQLEP